VNFNVARRAGHVQANVSAAEASVHRIPLQGFEIIVAPFDVRSPPQYDVGALISSSTAPPAQRCSYRSIQHVARLRQCPADLLNPTQDRQPAQLFVRNYPNRGFDGRSPGSTASIEPGTRTLRNGVDVPTPTGIVRRDVWGSAIPNPPGTPATDCAHQPPSSSIPVANKVPPAERKDPLHQIRARPRLRKPRQK